MKSIVAVLCQARAILALKESTVCVLTNVNSSVAACVCERLLRIVLLCSVEVVSSTMLSNVPSVVRELFMTALLYVMLITWCVAVVSVVVVVSVMTLGSRLRLQAFFCECASRRTSCVRKGARVDVLRWVVGAIVFVVALVMKPILVLRDAALAAMLEPRIHRGRKTQRKPKKIHTWEFKFDSMLWYFVGLMLLRER